MSATSAQTIDLDVLSVQLHTRAGYLAEKNEIARQGCMSLDAEWNLRVQQVLMRADLVVTRLSALARATAHTSAQWTATERALESSMGPLSIGLVWMLCQALPFVLSRSSQAAGSWGAPPVLTETPVRVRPVNRFQAEPPTNVEQLVSRIPPSGAQSEQIRIEKYAAEVPVYYVYLSGTSDFGLSASGEPWDMTSNVEAMAAHDAASVRAAEEAMRAAGITAQDQVIIVGHSQGGLVAARIAQSEAFRVTNLVTVGAPIHQIELPASTHVVAIEHREDVIPLLSGVAAAGTLGSTLTIRRTVAGIRGEPSDPLPAHNRARYIETAREIDRTNEPRITQATREVTAPAQGQAQVSTWRADRVK